MSPILSLPITTLDEINLKSGFTWMKMDMKLSKEKHL